MVLAGRTLSRVMVAASCLSWRLPVRVKASPRLIGALVGLLFGMALIATLVNQVRSHLGIAGAGFSFVMVFALYTVAWVFLSQLLPKPTSDPGALIPGACLVGLVLAGLQAMSQLVLPDQLDRASHLYGAIGTTLVTLGWFFILGRTVVFSMSLDAVMYERLGSLTHSSSRCRSYVGYPTAGHGCGATSTSKVSRTTPAHPPVRRNLSDRRCCAARAPAPRRRARSGRGS